MSAGRVLRALVSWTLLGLAVVPSLLLLAPVSGHQAFTVMSGSMEPRIHTGDVVVDRTVAPLEVRVGDIVTFRDPEDEARLITHRVRAIRARGATVEFETRGDANNTSERWTVPRDGAIGMVAYRIPRAGYVLNVARQPLGRILLVTVPALLLAISALVKIWRPQRRAVDPDAVPA
ncbi:MAG: signal peptidase I [Actinomycetota bacterium]|nr:signal peptidase I [Actinomycetota bacterium]